MGWLKKVKRRFREGQGTALLVVVCVAIITTSAVWTRQDAQPLPDGSEQPVAQLIQQTLPPSPTPTATAAWVLPVQGTVIGAFSLDLVQSSVTGVWRIHDAADIACSLGSEVLAPADGVVTSIGEDTRRGKWLTVAFDAATAELAGLAEITVSVGEAVRLGQVIAISGEGPADERDAEPHIHLRVMQQGQTIDPMGLFFPEK